MLHGGRSWTVLLIAVGLTSGLTGCGGGRVHRSQSQTTLQRTANRMLPVPTSYRQTCTQTGYCATWCNEHPTSCAAPVPATMRRPLRLPTLRSQQRCPITDHARKLETGGFGGMTVGRGPVLPVFAPPGGRAAIRSIKHGRIPVTRYSRRWRAIKTLWVSRPSYRGPVHIRARRLNGAGQVGFGEHPSVAGLLIPPGLIEANQFDGYREWPGGLYFASPGCYGFQIDGTNFSYSIILRTVAAHRDQ